MPPSKAANQERIDILLAMAIAHCRQQNLDEQTETVDCTEEVSSLLSALNNADLTLLRQRTSMYNELPDQEKDAWTARALSRVKNLNSRLDKDIHYTHIAEALRSEPVYVANFILRNLSAELRKNIASVLGFQAKNTERPKTVTNNLEKLLRQRFLANFVARENLPEVKPLSMLSGIELLVLLQQLGHYEIALVCRGIENIEDLAPFLRQFPATDAKAIVKIMTNLQAIERNRIEVAETTVHQAWQSEADSTLVVQQVGLKKLAAALLGAVDVEARYTIQKLPLNLVNKLRAMQTQMRGDQEYTRFAAAEVEATAARLLFEKSKENQAASTEAAA